MKIDGFDIDDLFDSEDLESIERKVEFERMLKRLSPRNKRITVLNAFGYTQVEIGEIVGLDRSQVSRILAKIHNLAE